MGMFFSFPLLTLFTLAIAVVLIVSMLRSNRRPGTDDPCRQCGTPLRPHANFCSRCGQKR